MELEHFFSPIPECLSTRKLARETIDGIYQGTLSISEMDKARIARIAFSLNRPFIDYMAENNMLTLGIIKPHTHESRDLPETDEEAAQKILSLIDPTRVLFQMPFKLTRAQAAVFYQPLEEMYSKKKMIDPNKYNSYGEFSVFESLLNFTPSGSITLLLLGGENAIENWRELMGKTNPEEADPNSIRGRHGLKEFMPNTLVHGSGSIDEVKREISLVGGFIQAFYNQASQ